MNVYAVKVSRHITGTRIEGYNFEVGMFNELESAVKYAESIIKKYGAEEYEEDGDKEYGEYLYIIHNNNYEQWPLLKVEIFKQTVDFNSGVVVQFSG